KPIVELSRPTVNFFQYTSPLKTWRVNFFVLAREINNSRARAKNISRQNEKILARLFRKNTRHLFMLMQGTIGEGDRY
ncbi:hypothetical protein, partial [Porphyromonas gingivalis]|uniref:hypothetical protein n=1 Tax=Porphyromonas gingivalis TaxID=837 RepID=UPI000B4E1D28